MIFPLVCVHRLPRDGSRLGERLFFHEEECPLFSLPDCMTVPS